MARNVVPLLILSLAWAAPALAQQADSASFVTLLGVDTLALERFVVAEHTMAAEVVLRAPRTTYARYEIAWDDAGMLERYRSELWEGPGPDGEPARRERVERQGAAYHYLSTGERGSERTFEVEAPVFPFIDMAHWPFELMLRRAHAAGVPELAQPLFSGGRVIPFVILRTDDHAFGVRHPTRGTMEAWTDEAGRMVRLDAGQTTRALSVERGPWIELEGPARSFAARDAAGGGVGELSGRGEEVATVHGANITVDYGTPRKRGREIFGGLLEYGRVWRTGANRATHFATDRDLVVDGIDVPAGTYTLFSIPRDDGGTLMINKRTDINGQQYDDTEDLARVSLRRDRTGETVEVFTIRVREEGEGGVIELLWDDTRYWVPFRVR